jgi:tRNA (Thr-GGU) A37 N-methylase
MTLYSTLEECPRNINVDGPVFRLVVNEDLHQGLMGLHAGQRILVLYWLNWADRTVLQQNSRRTGELAEIFAIRTPNRRNPIGAAVVSIESIENGTIAVRGLDCLNGTPLIDIKPAMTGK